MSARGPFDSAENYRWYLSGMYALHRHCESSTNWVAKQAELPVRENCLFGLLEHDLATLDAVVPEWKNLNSEHDVATQWAQAYVMEGSAVGASFMIRGAREKIGPEIGCKYLTQLASDAKYRWPKFVSELTASEIDADKAVAAACDVFKLAYDIFESPSKKEA